MPEESSHILRRSSNSVASSARRRSTRGRRSGALRREIALESLGCTDDPQLVQELLSRATIIQDSPPSTVSPDKLLLGHKSSGHLLSRRSMTSPRQLASPLGIHRRISSGKPKQLPSLQADRKKSKKPRCCVCNKKTGLAASYMCRCGQNFCATHRYPEMHTCSFDYKTEGRKVIESANPLVQPSKLPKI